MPIYLDLRKAFDAVPHLGRIVMRAETGLVANVQISVWMDFEAETGVGRESLMRAALVE